MGAGTRRGARCELCGGAAAVHCAADSAFLCLHCDARVHGANFLASRHLRRRLPGPAASPASSASSAGGAASSCVSTADSAESTAAAPAAVAAGRSARRRKRRAGAEAVVEGWAGRMGLASGPARRRAAAAAGALRELGRGVAAARVPLRVAMAAALWAEVASSPAAAAATGRKGGHHAALLARLEATAHVPARLVLTVASWMARARRSPPARDDGDTVEGWAECS